MLLSPERCVEVKVPISDLGLNNRAVLRSPHVRQGVGTGNARGLRTDAASMGRGSGSVGRRGTETARCSLGEVFHRRRTSNPGSQSLSGSLLPERRPPGSQQNNGAPRSARVRRTPRTSFQGRFHSRIGDMQRWRRKRQNSLHRMGPRHRLETGPRDRHPVSAAPGRKKRRPLEASDG